MSGRLDHLLGALEWCALQHPPLKPDRLRILLLVATGRADTPKDIAEAVGLLPSALSRILGELAGRTGGPPLLVAESDVVDVRVKRLRLTEKGSELIRELARS